MKIFLLKFLLFTAAVVLLPAACAQNGASNANNSANIANASTANENSNAAKDDPSELGQIINLPIEPDDSSVWRETDVPLPNAAENGSAKKGKKLIAVLKFSEEESEDLVKKLEASGAPAQVALEPESWFPPELIAQGGNSGDETIKGNSYTANDFAKAPYIGGKLTRILNTNYFVLELTTF